MGGRESSRSKHHTEPPWPPGGLNLAVIVLITIPYVIMTNILFVMPFINSVSITFFSTGCLQRKAMLSLLRGSSVKVNLSS